jgi:hypothetical protein
VETALATLAAFLASISLAFVSKTALSGFVTVRSLCLRHNLVLTVLIADENSAFPAGVNAAATWSTRLLKTRGNAMGSEHRGKGVNVQLGPVAGPLGRAPEGGRNWEGIVM